MDSKKTKTHKEVFFSALISITGLVGCLTVIILLGAVFGGIWLDRFFGTEHTYTFILVLVSIPVSVIAMVFAARALIRRIQPELDDLKKENPAEENRDRGS